MQTHNSDWWNEENLYIIWAGIIHKETGLRMQQVDWYDLSVCDLFTPPMQICIAIQPSSKMTSSFEPYTRYNTKIAPSRLIHSNFIRAQDGF